MVSIIVNDKIIETTAANINEFLAEKKLAGKHIVIELNGQILKKENYSSQVLNNGDKIAIINFVGGG